MHEEHAQVVRWCIYIYIYILDMVHIEELHEYCSNRSQVHVIEAERV
jgi:hypothetical protein